MRPEPDSRPVVRLGFAGFWGGFDPRDNFFTRPLARRWRVEVVERPDFLVHSCMGRGKHDHRRHDCVRIFYTGENVPPDWHSTDWAFAFENDSQPGYTTEKVADPMIADALPLYWGDPLVGRDFDTRSFLSAHDSGTLDDLVGRVIAVDRDPALHRELHSGPPARGPCASGENSRTTPDRCSMPTARATTPHREARPPSRSTPRQSTIVP